jgi:hypothetical protein
MSEEVQFLGSILVEQGFLNQESLDAALANQADSGKPLGEVLVEMGLLGEEGLRWALAEQMDLPLVHPEAGALDPEAVPLVSAEMCRRYGVLPLYLTSEGHNSAENVLTLAAADPAQRGALDDVASCIGVPMRVVAALREEIDAVLDQLYGPPPEADLGIRGDPFSAESLQEIQEDSTGDALLRHLLGSALERGEGGKRR